MEFAFLAVILNPEVSVHVVNQVGGSVVEVVFAAVLQCVIVGHVAIQTGVL